MLITSFGLGGGICCLCFGPGPIYKLAKNFPDVHVYTSFYAQVSLTVLKGRDFDMTYAFSYLVIIFTV